MTGAGATRIRATTAVVVLALVAAGCSRQDDPAERLAAALDDTFGGSLAYRLTVTADAQALSDLGEDGPAAAAFLNSFAVAGTRSDGGLSLRLQLFGQDLFEARQVGQDHTFLQLSLDRLPGGAAGLADPQTLAPALAQLALGPDLEAGVATLLSGGWLAIDGSIDLASLADDAVSGAATGAAGTIGTSTRERLSRFVVIDETTSADDHDTYRVRVELRALLEAVADTAGMAGRAPLAGVPATLPGSVRVVDGLVTRVRLDLSELGATRTTTGQVELQLDLSDHGSARAPSAPAADATVVASSLIQGLRSLLRFATAAGP